MDSFSIAQLSLLGAKLINYPKEFFFFFLPLNGSFIFVSVCLREQILITCLWVLEATLVKDLVNKPPKGLTFQMEFKPTRPFNISFLAPHS